MSTLESPSPDTTPGSEAERELEAFIDAQLAVVGLSGDTNAFSAAADLADMIKHYAREALSLQSAALSRETTDTQRLDAQDAAGYRFLRDNPIQLRAIDGMAGIHGSVEKSRFDDWVHLAMEVEGRQE